jgi:plasmid stabilization system protein ParE
LLRAFERLANAPYTGASSQRHPGLRDLVVANYRLFYTVDPDTGDVATAGDILIVAIIGPGQLPPPL